MEGQRPTAHPVAETSAGGGAARRPFVGRVRSTGAACSTCDDQFSPGLRSRLLRLTCAPGGGMEIDPGFFVDHD